MTSEQMAVLLAEEVRTYVDETLTHRLAPLHERITQIPTPIAGEKGEKGEPGPRGEPGEKGATGDRGDAGRDGFIGKDGRDGRDGKDGRDGIASRDELNALVAAEVEKRLEAEITKRIDAAIAAIPLVTYKGVYKEGESYAPGNMVTWGGDVWHCNAPTTEKPGGGVLWTLAVKKGRDGREPERAKIYNGVRP